MAKKKQVINHTNESHTMQTKKVIPKKIAMNDIILNDKQREIIKLIDENDIILINGPSGTSKTFIDCFYAIKSLKDEKFSKVIFTKPIQEAGERLGFLPGDIADKIDPFYESFRSNIHKLIRKQTLEKLEKNDMVEYRPLAFMRGSSFDNSLIILDEAQNCTWKQLMLFTTRMGKGSKVIISGDISQYDIKKQLVALLKFSEMISDIPGVSVFNFTNEDIMRHKILIEITKRYEKLKYNNKIIEEHR